jgi:regulatory protein YycI of two-component signal transduction system YycFG
LRLFIIIFTLFSFSLNANDINDLIGKKITLNWDNASCTYNLHSWYQITGNCTNQAHKIKNIVTDDGFSYIQWDNVQRNNGEGSFNEVLFFNNEGGLTHASLDNIDGAEWYYSSPQYDIDEIKYKDESEQINLIKKRLEFHQEGLLITAKYSTDAEKDTFLNCDQNFLHEISIDEKEEYALLNDVKNKKLLSKMEKFYKIGQSEEGKEAVDIVVEAMFSGQELEEVPKVFKKFSIEEFSTYMGLIFAYGFGCSGMFN